MTNFRDSIHIDGACYTEQCSSLQDQWVLQIKTLKCNIGLEFVDRRET